jgi:hypothetical protein
LKAKDIVKRMKQQHEELGQDCALDVYSYHWSMESFRMMNEWMNAVK